MTTQLLNSEPVTVLEGERDDDGHRTYNVTSIVKGDLTDGPANVMQTSGLFLPGATYLVRSDVDVYAYCTFMMKVRARSGTKEGERVRYWDVTQKFTTKPNASQSNGLASCKDFQFDNPLLEPMRISGGWVSKTAESQFDRYGNRIMTSSFEPVKGSQVEFDAGPDTVSIEQNVPMLQLALCNSMKHALNSVYMWGCPPRTVKLSAFDWDVKYYGGCFRYYTRKFKFDIDTVYGFDRDVLDQGEKVLRGKWDTNPASGTYGQYITASGVDQTNPRDFIKFQDFHGNVTNTVLDGGGLPYNPTLVRATAVSASPYNSADASGYKIGDLVSVNGGTTTAGVTARFRVHTLYPEGIYKNKVRTVRLERAGEYTTVPTNPVSLNNIEGSGTGLKLMVQWSRPESRPGVIHIEKFHEANFLLLGIPIVLE